MFNGKGSENGPWNFTIQDNILIGNPSHDEPPYDISKLVLDSLNKHPNFVGQINAQTGEKITFAEIKDRSVRCALWLKSQGIGKNDIVCISTPNQTDDYVPILATLYIGATINPWYSDISLDCSRNFFCMTKPKIMFACEGSIDRLAQAAEEANVNCKFVVYGKHKKYPSLRDLLANQDHEEVKNFHHIKPVDGKSQIGAIFFSSGTTGIPKGTMLSYNSLVKNRTEYMYILNCETALWYSSLSWITGANFMIFCLRHRITRIIHEKFDPVEIGNVVKRYKINWLFLTPSMAHHMWSAKSINRNDYSSVKTFLVGGSKISGRILEDIENILPHALVSNAYGMTELAGVAAIQSKHHKKSESIGHIVGDIKMKVLDLKTGRTLGPNQKGELCFKLDCVMLGYYKNATDTKKMIDSEGWLHTGDLGYYDEDGEIVIVDRIKEVIITQNYHVSPFEIEELLLKHPDVLDAAVVPVPHPVDVERPFAFIIKSPSSKVTAEELKEWPASYDEYFRLTGGIAFVDKMLYTSTGKKKVGELKEIAKNYVNYSIQ